MKSKFWGGVHPAGRKELSADTPPTPIPAPASVAIPLRQHIGKAGEPLVKVGDLVKVGQKIGDGDGMCVPVHASVSGRVTAIEERPHVGGGTCLSIVIENDGKDTPCDKDPVRAPWVTMDNEELINLVHTAGVVGMGGATFPTSIKASVGEHGLETLIANACECEPYITADDALLCTDPSAVIRGLEILRKILTPKETVIAIEDNKAKAIAVLREALKNHGDIRLEVLPTRYPQGAEKQLIQVITGKQVPSGGLPKDVGCGVFNVATCASVARAVEEGQALTRRIVTVTGPGVKDPKNLMVPIGTSFEDVIAAAGGLTGDVWRVIAGGPMMGKAQPDLSAAVTKGVNAIVVLTQAENGETEHHSCIRCGKCVAVCPMGLQPLYLYRFANCGDTAALKRYKIMDCIECGCCAYTCPGKLLIVDAIRRGKQMVKEGK